MLSCNTVKSLLKSSSRRVAADTNGNSAEFYILQNGFHTDPTRALSQLHTLLLEGDLRQLWQQTKQRLKAQLQDAYTACQPQAAASKPSSKIAAEELQRLYGTDGIFRTAVMYILAHASRSFMTVANSTTVEGAEHMQAALDRRQGRPLITVCNHVASMDDPLVMSTILPPEVYSDASQLRWTLCASDRCFHRQLLVPFFRAAKVLPVDRGSGMFQAGLAAAEERLLAGDWVHIFPEGTRSRDGKMGPVRKGVGRLVAACSEGDPVIVPFVHSGMGGVLPKGSLLPKTNQQIKVLVGEAIDVSDILSAAQQQGWSDNELYSRIANRIGSRMSALKAQLDGLPLDEMAQQQQQQQVLEQGLDLYDPIDNEHRARTLWERVSFRMQHREWAVQGVASAKARLQAAAASLSRAASDSSFGRLGDPAAEAAEVAGIGGENEQQLPADGSFVLAGATAAAGLNAAADHPVASKLALVTNWLSPGSLCSKTSEYYSYQRSVAMMQLLQARL